MSKRQTLRDPRVDDVLLLLARNVRTLRKQQKKDGGRRHWSQSDLAERVGWSLDRVKAIENPKPWSRRVLLTDLPPLAKALGTTVANLLREEGEPVFVVGVPATAKRRGAKRAWIQAKSAADG